MLTPREPRIDAAKLEREYRGYVDRLASRYPERLRKMLATGDPDRITGCAVRMIGDHRNLLVYGYAAGVDFEELSAAAGEACGWWERLFGLIQEHGPSTRNKPFYLDLETPAINEFFGITNLVSFLLGLGRRADAKRILELPAVQRCDDVVLQFYRQRAGAELTGHPLLWMPKACGPWAAVANATPPQRPAALAAYARGWAGTWGMDDPARRFPNFCFDIVPLVLALDIDDGEARTTTPDYPADLVNYARSQASHVASGERFIDLDTARRNQFPAAGAGVVRQRTEPVPLRRASRAGGRDAAVAPPADLAALADVALVEADLAQLGGLVEELAEVGPDEFHRRYLDEIPLTPFAGDPRPLDVLISLGLRSGTIVETDWSGEPEPGAVRFRIGRACHLLGLSAPVWERSTEDAAAATARVRGDYVPALLRSLDRQLTAVSVRLLQVAKETDSYIVVPVSAERFMTLIGHQGEGYRLAEVASM